jgi:hypothetical protein
MISLPELYKYRNSHLIVSGSPVNAHLKLAGEIFGIKIYENHLMDSREAYLVDKGVVKFTWVNIGD